MTSTMAPLYQRWFRCYRPVEHCAGRLICLPHAGGSASAFRTWARALPPDVELLVAQYPGRQDRISEPHVRDMDALLAGLIRAMRPVLDRPLALLGNSMGAAVAYELAQHLGSACAQLFVSGRPGPSRQRPGVVHLSGDDGLLADVRNLGGVTPEVLEDPVLRELFLPTLRADYQLIETYRPTTSPLPVPVMALMGSSDPEVDEADARAWAAATTGEFELRWFDGGHFFLTDRPDDVVKVVAERLAGSFGVRDGR
ncbi:thioesterase II family protein [Saccharopolyspora spinosa]|uniref:Pyochelin biosynthetic protein PchC n=1 Tax=Saccharopolyspora spinosa TaxID=60894 RepID=A0A2N3Y6C0_SACSN|nr:alpha/beta fold hydrolase [Saccharopolyspora spinosa]PKW18435.1 pyochelin biosynthetic protein PchC [Saccharopolyspora spinosa]